VRGPECRHHLEAGFSKIRNPEEREEREALELIRCEVIDLDQVPGVVGRQSVPAQSGYRRRNPSA
jgi:hypothetical protein